MTRRDYKAIALILAGDLATASSEEMRQKVRGICLSLADYFARTNERFDRTAFYLAVGMSPVGA